MSQSSVASYLRESRNTVIFTGAGMSTESTPIDPDSTVATAPVPGSPAPVLPTATASATPLTTTYSPELANLAAQAAALAAATPTATTATGQTYGVVYMPVLVPLAPPPPPPALAAPPPPAPIALPAPLPPPAPLAPPAPVAPAAPVAPPAPAADAAPAAAPATETKTEETSGAGPTISNGSSGQAVRRLQERLKELGFDPGPIDGEFGPLTEAAVRAFQTSKEIDVDGIVGPQTWGKLGITVGAGPTVRQGFSGEGIKRLQARLQELGFDPQGVDGQFGPNTDAAVKAFQKAKGLETDGIVGPQTWDALGIVVTEAVSGPAGTDGVATSGADGTTRTIDGKPITFRQGQGMHANIAADWDRMFAAAKADGVTLSITSGFRSVAEQKVLWDEALIKYGSASAASKWVAPPGKSNHQQGKALDINGNGAHEWLRKNGGRFGFNQPMSWEPWHWEHAI